MRNALAAIVCMCATGALAAGDFPVASCASWNGTVVERSGIDTRAAAMQGIVTKADLQDYCERDPGGETKPYGGSLSTDECVAKYMKKERRTKLVSEANCRRGTIKFRYGSDVSTAKFPLDPEADRSCASGLPP